jgi:predicted regulator of Ras-like GTPase activity (Roadblock/LC7/MglB family)
MAWFWLFDRQLSLDSKSALLQRSMFALVKNWFRKSADFPSAEKPAPELQEPDYPTESNSGYVEPAGSTAPDTGEPLAPVDNNTAQTTEDTQTLEGILPLPLASVFNVLASDLQARVRLPLNGSANIAVPLETILPQLDRGSVKISFGELRQMSPEATFYSQTDRDQAVVELPLAEILARLAPNTLPRRAQRRVDVPEEITSPFNGTGEGLHIYKPDPTPPQGFVRNVEKIEDPWTVSMFQQRGTNPSPVPSHFAASTVPVETEPTVPTPVIQCNKSLPRTSILVQTAAQPVNRNGDTLSMPLTQLAEDWPDAIKREITQMNLFGAFVSLPLALAEESLKKGKAVYAWKQIRSWTNSSPATMSSSPHDAELLEFPLRVVAPLLMARLHTTRPQKTAPIDSSIPDLFSAIARSNPATPSADSAIVPTGPTVTPPTALPVAPIIPSTVSPDTGQFLRTVNLAEARGKARQVENDRSLRSGTEFLRRYATPNEIVAKTSKLEGVEGALIALPDGLLVASHLAGNLNGDTLAAFVPQLFGRVSQSAREFRMGELTEIRLVVGSTPWSIFKVGAIFLAVFGRPGETLPEEQLKSLADELDRKKQQ